MTEVTPPPTGASAISPALLLAEPQIGSSWTVLLSETVAPAVAELIAEADAQSLELRVLNVGDDMLSAVDHMEEGSPACTLVVFDHGLPRDAAPILDLNRSRLPTDRAMLLLLTYADAVSLFAASLHFSSLVQRAMTLDLQEPVMTPADVESRLEALRRWARTTDADILARAAAGNLPQDPEYAEWLILLGRGELLVDR